MDGARLKEELVKSRRAVREKYQSLKNAEFETQARLEQTYKPLTQPLEKLISAVHSKSEPLDIKAEAEEGEERSFNIDNSAYETSTPRKQKRVKVRTGKTPVLPSQIPSFFDNSLTSKSQLPSFLHSTVIGETTPPPLREESSEKTLNLSDILEQSKLSIQPIVNTPAYSEWLETFHELPRNYIDANIKDTKHSFDHQYGIIHDIETDKFFLGLTQKPVELIGKDVKVAGITYPGTVGLYELLFKVHPLGYKKDDLDDYMDILKRTNAYRRNHDPSEQVQGTKSPKYITIIAPYLQEKGITKTKNIHSSQTSFSRPAPPLSRPRMRKGSGLILKNHKSQTDYVYWNDLNELVDRLRLLTASTAAGHTGHNNEIISIIEELREADVIV